MIRLLGTIQFDVVGDGVSTQMLIPLRAFVPPAPLQPTLIPTAFTETDVIQGVGTATAKLEGEFVRVTFNTPPSATTTTTLKLLAGFGTDRIG
jgi:hypothetical protein